MAAASAVSYKSKLSKLKKGWQEASKREPGKFATVEDGIYEAKLAVCKLSESISSGRLQVAWGYVIAKGENKGQQVRDYEGLESEDNLFYLQRKLAQLGADIPEDPAEIESVLKKLEKKGPLVKIRVNSKDGFTHVYIQGLSEGDESEPDTDSEEEPKDPDAEPEAEAEAEEESEAEPEAEEETLSVDIGDVMEFSLKGQKYQGEILEFVDDDTKARIKEKKTGKEIGRASCRERV